MARKPFSRREFIQKGTLAAIAVSSAADVLSKVLGLKIEPTISLVNHAFRLTKWESLLNLEFYFVNFNLSNTKLTTIYGQQESYMIVRLPQQHIAEQSLSFTTAPKEYSFLDSYTAVTRISGYSYLVFRVHFDPYKTKAVSIAISEDEFLDWNNKLDKNFELKLVVRQNLTESLFEIETKSMFGELKKENIYPLGYSGSPIKYDFNAFPKVYGDPVTALELPWRIILSPKLPNQDKFKFRWHFSDSIGDNIATELWTASLTIEENKEYVEKADLKGSQDKGEKPLESELEEEIRSIELMLMGSPDYSEKHKDLEKDFSNVHISIVDKNITGKILPTSEHREKLIELYIKYKILAHTDKLMFSPLGVSTFIELKNSKIETTGSKTPSNDIFGWKQLISFGRDEEVEVIKLILEKELGHKYLHISTTKRRTMNGTSYLEYREYIKPLDVSKDFKNHENEKDKQSGNVVESKFKTPFQFIEIKELKPKRIKPLTDLVGVFAGYKSEIKTKNYKNENETGNIYIPVDYYTQEPVKFEYEGVDWQDQKVKFSKHIQAIELNVAYAGRQNKKNVNDINKFFDGGISHVDDFLKLANDKITLLSANPLGSVWGNFYENYSKIPELLKRVNYDYHKRILIAIEEAQIYSIQPVKDLYDAIKKDYIDLETCIEFYKKDTLSGFKTKLDAAITEITELKKQGSVIIESAVFHILSEAKIATTDIITQIETIEGKFPAIWNEVSDAINFPLKKLIEREMQNRIELFQQKVAYTVKNFEGEADKFAEDTISNLKTNYLLFSGRLREAEDGAIDFFNQYASMPQLQKAEAFASSLNKLLNEEVPINFKYAKEYVNNQLDLGQLEVKKNTSKVFVEITQASQDYLKGQLRKVASEMGGFINPELPVEYMTYLKDPKKLENAVVDEFKKGIPAELKDSFGELKDGYNDLIFISGKAKESWDKVRQIRPEDFFDGLKAKILGSIELKDILGIDFELPRMSIIKDNNGLPEKVVYNFLTNKIKEKDLIAVMFYSKNKGKSAMFQIYMEKGIKNPKQYFSYTRLSDFSIGIKPIGPELLTIFFGKLEVSSSNLQTKKTEVVIDDIKFGGPLDFVGKLAESLKIPGTGLRIIPSLKEIEIGYLFTMPAIETPSFNIANIKFDLGLNIPMPNPRNEPSELITSFSINNPEDKFLVSAGIFGGRGHFVIKATPRKIVKMDASIEFGGYLGINLGIAKGYVFLFVGIRFQQDADGVLLTAYIICSGGVTVFGFISVSVTFLLSMRYNVRTNELYGTASVSYSIKIGFFKKSFTLSYSKTLKGTKGKKIDPNTEQQAYLGKGMSDVQYASVGEELLLYEESTNENTTPIEGSLKTEFRNIYTQDEWTNYYNAFVRE